MVLSRLSLAAVRARRRLRTNQEARRASAHPNALFVWIPKTAGTSMFQALQAHGMVKLKTPTDIQRHFRGRGRVTFGHVCVADLVSQGLVERAFVESAYVFCLVRNPYDRALSLFNYLRNNGRFAHWRREPGLSEFLELTASGFIDRVGLYNFRGLSQCNPQSDWLEGLKVDDVFKIEEVETAALAIAERMGVPGLALPRANPSSGLTREDLSADDIRHIERFYAVDFERFGYPLLGARARREPVEGMPAAAVQITPQMVHAGVRAYVAWEESDSHGIGDLASVVYAEMNAARRGQDRRTR